MEQRHKQRVIGAVVIVALAVIFLPMLLRGPVEHRSLDVPMEIPPRPDSPVSGQPAQPPEEEVSPALERIPVHEPEPEARAPEPEPPAELPGMEAEADDEVVAEPELEPEPEPEPEPPPALAPEDEREAGAPATPELASWAVQVGSFRSRDNAVKLRDQLREKEFAAFVEESQVGDSAIYRLRVGPVVERSEATELLEHLRERAELDGIVVSHP